MEQKQTQSADILTKVSLHTQDQCAEAHNKYKQVYQYMQLLESYNLQCWNLNRLTLQIHKYIWKNGKIEKKKHDQLACSSLKLSVGSNEWTRKVFLFASINHFMGFLVWGVTSSYYGFVHRRVIHQIWWDDTITYVVLDLCLLRIRAIPFRKPSSGLGSELGSDDLFTIRFLEPSTP